ncbi:Rha family transcriptional regulator [Salmonella enterica]|nr:Rha family transcriptional regulator [Salmonella enterica]
MTHVAVEVKQELISSLDIAKEFGKAHRNIKRDIKAVSANTGIDFVESVYVDPCNREHTQFLINEELADALRQRYTGLRFGLSAAEKIALNTIEQVLGVTLIRQYRVLNYRIDGYDAVNNIAYEIDEPAHLYKKEHDEIRQRRIENELGCKFVRIKV